MLTYPSLCQLTFSLLDGLRHHRGYSPSPPKSRGFEPRARDGQKGGDDGYRLFLANIPFSATEDDIYRYNPAFTCSPLEFFIVPRADCQRFASHHNGCHSCRLFDPYDVKSATIARDKEGRPRGFAFVTVGSQSGMDGAFTLNGELRREKQL